MKAIISDIHGNLEALEAVLDQIGEMEVICLGDVVCYGPDSIECVRRSRAWNNVVAGPLDHALLNLEQDKFNPSFIEHIEKLKLRFSREHDSHSLIEIVESYRTPFAIDEVLYFHGIPESIYGYIFPEDVHFPKKLNRHVDTTESVFIGGGSHLPGIFVRSDSGWEFLQPENGRHYPLKQGEKTIFTIGSVGQSRDGDSRAAYAIVDHGTITFHRIDYDIQSTMAKIKDDPDIDGKHRDRLPFGR